ncbi:hypothetical protein C8R43DRAFT_1134954 [Mycena crocata]|nr:hypothetical protein C8R43DRAFT_1134954 [Mycena crocata]
MSDPPDTLHPHPPDTLPHSLPAPVLSSPSNLIAKPSEAVATEADSVHVTVRRRRVVPPLPKDAEVVHPPTPHNKATNARRDTSSPYRPAPQIRVVKQKRDDATTAAFVSDESLSPEVTSGQGTPGVKTRSSAQGKRGGTRAARNASGESPPRADRQDSLPAPDITSDYAVDADESKPKKKQSSRDSAKREKYMALKERTEAAGSLDDLADILRETVATLKIYSGSPPTKPCLELLGHIQERLAQHHEFPAVAETAESFSTVVSRSVSAPVKALTVQVEAQQRAILSLTKTVESIKNAPVLSPPHSSPSSPSTSYANVAAAAPQPKPKPPPLPNPSDERILIRFNGPVPPILQLTYPQILAQLNAHLEALHLPTLMYTQKQSASSLFIVPKTKSDIDVLTRRWDEWGLAIFPGAHIAPAATYCFVQIDGIPFASAGSLADMKHQFEERNPALGRTVGTPVWVNKPPSEARLSAIAASGRTVPTAGSIFIRLQSREMVDLAVMGKRIILAGTAPVVNRGFPNLRVVQCWGCYKYGHTRGRCGVTEALCGGCGKAAHGAFCAEKPSCVNCSGAHRSDSFACPSRKRIAEQLRQRAVDTCRMLDEEMYARLQKSPSPSSPQLDRLPSPLTSALGLSQLPSPNDPMAPRLPERF